MGISEAALGRAVLRTIKQRWPQAWVLGGRHSVAGVPDLILCGPGGHFLALELKTPRGHVTPIQAATLEKIRRAGGVAEVVRSVEETRCLVTGL